jgi:hypothetical protein
VAARDGDRAVVALCEHPEVTPDALAKVSLLGRAQHAEVLLVHSAQPPTHARVRPSEPGSTSRRLRLISVAFPPSRDLLEVDTWIYAESLLEAAETGA